VTTHPLARAMLSGTTQEHSIQSAVGKGILGRWDEKANPPYAVPLEGLQAIYGL
jgi:hypothetical protein